MTDGRPSSPDDAASSELFERAPVGLWMTDLDGRILAVNGPAAEMLGYAPSDLVGRSMRDVAHPADLVERARHRVLLAEGHLVVARRRLAHRDGHHVVVEGRARAISGGRILTVVEDVGAIERANAAVVASEREFRAIFELAASGKALAEPSTGRFLRVNPKLCEITGYSEAELLTMTFVDLAHPEDRERDLAALRRALEGGEEDWTSEKRYVTKDGEVRWVVVSGRVVRTGDGRPLRTVATVHDITDRKRGEEAIRELNTKLRRHVEELQALIDDSPVGIAIAEDPACAVVRINRAMAEILGVPRDANASMTPAGGPLPAYRLLENGRDVPPRALPMQRCVAHAVAIDGEELHVLRPDGTERVVVNSARPLFDESGRVRGCVSVCTDLTAQKRAEVAAASVARFPAENPDPVLRLSRDLEIVYANPSAVERLGIRRGDRPPPSIASAALESARRDDKLRVELAVGERFFSFHFVPVGGELNVYGQDVTARRRAEDALRESTALLRAERAFLRQVIDADTAVITVKDARNRFVLANASAGAYFGTTPDRLVGRSDRDFVPLDAAGRLPPEYEEVYAAEQEALRTGRMLRHEFALTDPLGRRRWFASVKVPLAGEDGTIDKLLVVATDVTEQRRIEESLRQADRRKDEFLAMLSHELRNPLAPVRNSIHILRRAPPGSDAAQRAQAVIERQVEHITKLVDDLLDVTRIARGKIQVARETLDLAEVTRRTVEDLASVLEAKGLRVRAAVPRQPAWVTGDATRLAQAIGNLLQNAGKFTPPGGEVDVELATGGGQVAVRVRDSGVGIPPEMLAQVFEPFVQAEQALARSQGGLGLGLALVKGVVELHGGAVRAASAGEGKGAEFTVTLPLAPPPPRAATRLGRGGGAGVVRRVLVVDDNADAADSLAELVRLLGHEPEVALDAETALERVRARAPNVLLCDIGLPGITGYELAARLRSDGFTAVRMVAVTGYASPEDRRRAADAGFDDHLAKPPDPAELARVLS